MNKKDLKKRIESYDPDTELSGSGNVDYGHNLADEIMKYSESKENHFEESLCDNKNKNLLDILKYTPKQIKNSRNFTNKIKGELGRMKEAGCNINDYSKMSSSELWNYYIRAIKFRGYFNKN